MQLLVFDPTYDQEGSSKVFLAELRKEVALFSSEVQLVETDIGRAAAEPAVLITIGSFLGGIFFLGKKIEENLDAWISLSRRFVALLNSIRRKFGSFRICKDGASLLAMDRIINMQIEKVSSIERTSEKAIFISPLSGRSQDNLDYRPDALYVQIYKVNDRLFYVFGVKSTGTIEVEYSVDASNWMEF